MSAHDLIDLLLYVLRIPAWCVLVLFGLGFVLAAAFLVNYLSSDDEEDECDGCGAPAVTSDSEGVPLCQACFDCLDPIESEDEL